MARIWTWMHANPNLSEGEIEQRLARFRDGGIDGIFFLAYDGRNAYFPTERVPVAGNELERVSKIANELGLEVHAWMFTLNCNVSDVLADHPDWFVVNRKGNSTLVERPYVDYYNWLCPNQLEARQFVLDIVRDLSQQPGIEGVHLDYIRFPDVILPKGLHAHYGLVQDREFPEYDYCYCPACKRLFAETTGIDPMELNDPSENAEWRRFREESITRLVQDAAAIIHEHGKRATAAVFATPSLARRLVRQNWPEWPLDAFYPMMYHRFYDEPAEWIEQAAREGRKALPETVPLYAGVFLADLPGERVARALSYAVAGGAGGISLFCAEEITDAHLQALANAKRQMS